MELDAQISSITARQAVPAEENPAEPAPRKRARKRTPKPDSITATQPSKLSAVAAAFAAPHRVAVDAALAPAANLLVLGIDPDTSGALAVLQWQLPDVMAPISSSAAEAGQAAATGAGTAEPAAEMAEPRGAVSTDQSSCSAMTADGLTALAGDSRQLLDTGAQAGAPLGSTDGSSQALFQPAAGWDSAELQLAQARVSVYDMPCLRVPMGKRERKQLDPASTAALVAQLCSMHPGSHVRAVLEEPVPNALNGKYSWYGAGYSAGVWKGLLVSLGIPYDTVTARRWKMDLQLNSLGKEGSRELAKGLFPDSLASLKRKKDHGRAEAMLIAAWGVGLRLSPPSPAAPTGLMDLAAAMEAVLPEEELADATSSSD